MLILLIRHARREYREDRQDAEQILTPIGQKEAAILGQKIASRLASKSSKVSVILTSTYARAQETAAIIAPWLGLTTAHVQSLAALQTEPDGSVEASYAAVKVVAVQGQGVVVVGHGPDLASLCQRLTGTSVELKKAQAQAIDWDVASERGRLLWRMGYKPSQDDG